MVNTPTLKDIAQRLNVSISTVSRAIRNSPDVKPETKKSILALVEEFNYQPSQLALSLRNKQTHTIGVLVPNLDYVLSMMVRGIDEIALESGYTVMICQSNESYGREILNTRRLLDSLVDGLIISVSSETKTFEHFKKIQEKNIPMVLFDRVTPELKVPSVRIDNEGGGFQATEHLIEQGYKRIAILAGPENLEISNRRMDGYLNALRKHNIKIDESLIFHCDFNQDYAYMATKELLLMKNRPDAIFAISDRLAVGAMLAIKEAGLNMPKEFGLVGFNNEPITKVLTPSITSVEMHAFEMGKATAKLFIQLLHGEEDLMEKDIIIKPKLYIRESSNRGMKVKAK
jgi:LacI family transcriptional regulator